MLSACAGLRPQLIQAAVQKPSNVAVYFTVDTAQGEPVPGLSADSFRIYEDNRLVSVYESKQTILNPEVAASHNLLLLVDMSGSIRESGELPALEEAASQFTSRVGQLQQTAVYGFDGRPEIAQIRAFSQSDAKVSLSSFVTKDPSTNLNGAVLKALEVLQKQVDQSTSPLRFGTLVVFTDGTDQAHRVTREQLHERLHDTPFEIYVIGVGAEIDEGELRAIGRSGASLSTDPTKVSQEFDAMASRIEGYMKRFYLLSYCSPSRAGEHALRIEPVSADGKTGSLEYMFRADGFQPNCDPNKKPAFDLLKPRVSKGPGTRRRH